jgi:pyrroloquinoline-quinone synthase
MDRDVFREALLAVMERKDHWAWPAFTSGRVDKTRLHVHFEQEYATYVRDFPVMVGRAYVQCPISDVRRALAENLYEEETGGLVAGHPHPELFLEYPRGLGMDLTRFADVKLLPAARAYRAFLDGATERRGWEIAASIVTLFIEGTKDERDEMTPTASKRRAASLEEHPLVKHYGLAMEHLALTRVHREVEGGHRAAAWRTILDFVPAASRDAVVAEMEAALDAWLRYRDDVALACGIERDSNGRPKLAAGR